MKRKIALVLATIMALSTTVLADTTMFNDVEGSWAKEEINEWAKNNVVKGFEGEFRPDDSITRGEMATIINNIMEYQVSSDENFSDINGDEWFADAVKKNNANGVMKGYDNNLRPNDLITREEALVMLGRALSMGTTKGNTKFYDDSQISTWAKGYVNEFYNSGLVEGRENNRFEPNDFITRAEVVKIVDNSVNNFFNVEGEYSKDIFGKTVVNTSDVVLSDMVIDGDLIVAAGVAEGELTLDNVVVTGEIIVEGGGDHSILLNGNTKVNKIKTKKVDNQAVRLFVSKNSSVENIETNGAKTLLEGTGDIDKVTTIGGEGLEVREGTSINELEVNGGDSIDIAENAEINKVKINVSVTFNNDGKIESITISSLVDELVITGDGEVEEVTINGDSDGIVIENDVDNVIEDNDDNNDDDDDDDDDTTSGAAITIAEVKEAHNNGVTVVTKTNSPAKRHFLFSNTSNETEYTSEEIVNMINEGDVPNNNLAFSSRGYNAGKQTSKLTSNWFEEGTDYVLTIVAEDKYGNVSEQTKLSFTTLGEKVVVSEIGLYAEYLGRDNQTGEISFRASDDINDRGVTFNYIAIPVNAPTTSGSSLTTSDSAITVDDILNGVDSLGNAVDYKGSETAVTGNFVDFSFVGKQDEAYEIYIVATHGEVVSEIAQIIAE